VANETSSPLNQRLSRATLSVPLTEEQALLYVQNAEFKQGVDFLMRVVVPNFLASFTENSKASAQRRQQAIDANLRSSPVTQFEDFKKNEGEEG
jgi:hypothetical protein